jgi:hypothetical protein
VITRRGSKVTYPLLRGRCAQHLYDVRGLHDAHRTRICVTYALDSRRMRASHPRIRRKCCVHLPHEERATRNVTFGPICRVLYHFFPFSDVGNCGFESGVLGDYQFIGTGIGPSKYDFDQNCKISRCCRFPRPSFNKDVLNRGMFTLKTMLS